MIIFKTVLALQRHLDKLNATGKSVGFVPTMGALHPGHLSLIQQSRQQTETTVVSIFVNPTQFNDPKDFEKYPVTIENDCLLLEKQQTDILFLPTVNEMYPAGISSQQHYQLSNLENLLDGKFRPGHFQGVCQVVQRLLEIVKPAQLFLGQKDYQQCMVIQRLIEIMNISTRLNIVTTQRETDGLAMSSRNLRLSQVQREKATAIYQQLQLIKQHFSTENINRLKQIATANLLEAGFAKVDYIEITDAGTLEPLPESDKSKKAVALAAAFIGEVRLIDNLLLN